MRLAVYLAVMLATGYLAGIYRYYPLMVLFVAELLFLLLLLFVCIMHRIFFRIDVGEQTQTIFRGSRVVSRVTCSSLFPLPLSRARIRILRRYNGDRLLREDVFWTGKTGDGRCLEILSYGNYCGIFTIRLTELTVSDYLGLFSLSRKLDREMTITVLPYPQSMELSFTDPARLSRTGHFRSLSRTGTEGTEEFRQLREYRDGDSPRRVDWHRTAAGDQLYIREYEKEEERALIVLLEYTPDGEGGDGDADLTPVRSDRFYTCAAALMRGLMRQTGNLRVFWYDERENRVISLRLSAEEMIDQAMVRLYEGTVLGTADTLPLLREQAGIFEEDYFRLNGDLELYYGEEKIFRFSEEDLAQEIGQVRIEC